MSPPAGWNVAPGGTPSPHLVSEQNAYRLFMELGWRRAANSQMRRVSLDYKMQVLLNKGIEWEWNVSAFFCFLFISPQQDSSLVILAISPLGFIFRKFWRVGLLLATLPLQQPLVKHPHLPSVMGSLLHRCPGKHSCNSSFGNWNKGGRSESLG